jgi:hypothetical protein
MVEVYAHPRYRWRSGLTITYNFSLDSAHPAASTLIEISGWRGVTIRHNRDYGMRSVRAVALHDVRDAVIESNEFVGFWN